MAKQANLEQLLEEAKNRNKQPLMREPVIEPNGYDRETFLKYYYQWEDLLQAKYVQALSENIDDPDAREDLSAALYGDPNAFENAEFDDARVFQTAKSTYTTGIDSLAKYVQVNKRKFLEILDENALNQLVRSLPMYKNGDEKHDGLVKLLNEIKGMTQIMQMKEEEGKAEGMREYVAKNLKSTGGLTKDGVSLFSYLIQKESIAQYMFKRLYDNKQQEFVLSLAKQDGDRIVPDRKKYVALIDKSLDRAENALTADIKDKDKKKIWEKSLRPHYVAMAQMGYAIEKPKYEAEIKTEREKEIDANKKALKDDGIQM